MSGVSGEAVTGGSCPAGSHAQIMQPSPSLTGVELILSSNYTAWVACPKIREALLKNSRKRQETLKFQASQGSIDKTISTMTKNHVYNPNM